MKREFLILLLFVFQIAGANKVFAGKTDPPTVAISYPFSAICQSASPVQVLMMGSGNYTGGLFSANAGLVINPVTGAINPTSSIPGMYVVTYHLAATADYPTLIATAYVEILAQPFATLVATQSSVCNGSTTMICIMGTPNATVEYGLTAQTGFATVTLDASGMACLQLPPLSSALMCTLMSVTGTGTPACTTYLSEAVTIAVTSNPQIQLAPTAELVVDNSIVVAPVLLDSNLSGSNFMFQWYLNNEPIEDATNPTYNVDTIGPQSRVYTVRVTTVPGGCHSEASCIVTQTVLATETVDKAVLSFGPNPFSESMVLQAGTVIREVMIHNLLGQRVYQKVYDAEEVTVDTSRFPSGTYFITAVTDYGKRVLKAIKS